jgi:hypothetical protein
MDFLENGLIFTEVLVSRRPDQSTMYIAESDLNNSAPTTSCGNCYWEHHRRTYWEHLGTQTKYKIYLSPTPK